MKISTKGRYGLRAMIDLAVYGQKEHISLGSIAERQALSTNYLEQVFSLLRKAEIVHSVKGAQGGYMLSKPANTITVKQILTILEGSLMLVDPIPQEKETPLKRCLEKLVWREMNKALDNIVSTVMLEDLAENYRQKMGISQTMFYI